jgi:HTH-type transcriptional regulator / antitoxin HigA
MQIINRSLVQRYAAEHQRSATALHAWCQLVSSYDWPSREALQATFPAATIHEDLVAFDLRGSSLFVIATLDLEAARLWVHDIQIHSTFRSGEWMSHSSAIEPSAQSYQDLIAELPLRPVRDQAGLQRCLDQAIKLLQLRERTADQQDYLDVLFLLINDYEAQHVEIPAVSAAEIVRSLVQEHRLSQVEIIPLLGGKEKAMALLKGTRPLDLKQATRCARYFKLPMETFVDPDDLEIEMPRAASRRR